MGKGDKRTRRGKIFAGSYGKTRQRPGKPVFVASAEPKAAADATPKKRAPKRIPKAASAETDEPMTAEAPERSGPGSENTVAEETGTTEETTTASAPEDNTASDAAAE